MPVHIKVHNPIYFILLNKFIYFFLLITMSYQKNKIVKKIILTAKQQIFYFKVNFVLLHEYELKRNP